MTAPEVMNGIIHAAGGYGPPGGGGYGGPPGGGAPPGGGGYGGPPGGGAPPGGGGYGGPPQGGGYGGPPQGGGFGGPPQGGGYGGPPQGGGFGGPPPGGYGGGFGPPGGGFPPPGGPMGPGMGQDINTTLPLILNIVAMIFCCGLSFFLGVGGLIIAIQASSALKTGDIETARSKAKTATILAIAAFVLGLLQNISYAIFANR